MKITSQLKEAIFLQRVNRFSCRVKMGDKEERVYLPNSGRLKELLVPGRKVLLNPATNRQRRTGYDLTLVALENTLVSADSRIPNQLVSRALRAGTLPEFDHYTHFQTEPRVGNRRLDFLLERDNQRCLLEVKSVTLVRLGRAFFPDAPTLRGRRHLELLTQAKKAGQEAAILFVVQREDAQDFSPNDEADPQFGHTLRQAAEQGVAVYAYRCKVSTTEIELADRIPVYLAGTQT